jgi:hypothetical protein
MRWCTTDSSTEGVDMAKKGKKDKDKKGKKGKKK